MPATQFISLKFYIDGKVYPLKKYINVATEKEVEILNVINDCWLHCKKVRRKRATVQETPQKLSAYDRSINQHYLEKLNLNEILPCVAFRVNEIPEKEVVSIELIFAITASSSGFHLLLDLYFIFYMFIKIAITSNHEEFLDLFKNPEKRQLKKELTYNVLQAIVRGPAGNLKNLLTLEEALKKREDVIQKNAPHCRVITITFGDKEKFKVDFKENEDLYGIFEPLTGNIEELL
jgi:hypothetical protein